MGAVSEVPVGPICRHLRRGALIPFLGAGASIVSTSSPEAASLPLGKALARKLAEDYAYPDVDDTREDLARVASYCEKVQGTRSDLKESIEEIFSRRIEPGPIHRLLASIDAPLLILTTNYDNLIETAFDDVGRPYHLIVYPADEQINRGAVLWRSSDLRTLEFRKPASLVITAEATIIYKMHGTFDYSNTRNHHFVISEEDYVRYLADNRFPPILQTRMRGKRFLFLGYGLRDWNFRVMLHKLDPANISLAARTKDDNNQHDDWKSWAIMKSPSRAERQIWSTKQVELCEAEIDAVAAELTKRLKETGAS
jgi:SIR2-like domain